MSDSSKALQRRRHWGALERFHNSEQVDDEPTSLQAVRVSTPALETLKPDLRILSLAGDDLGDIVNIGKRDFATKTFGITSVSLGTLKQTAARVVLKELGSDRSTGREDVFWGRANNEQYVLPFLGRCMDRRGVVYLVSPYLKHGDLGRCMRDGMCSPQHVAKWLPQILRGLNYLHDEIGIVHGDFKADNVMITDDEDAVIADFGLSRNTVRAFGDPTTSPGVRTMGTELYLSPEQMFHRIQLCLHITHPVDSADYGQDSASEDGSESLHEQDAEGTADPPSEESELEHEVGSFESHERDGDDDEDEEDALPDQTPVMQFLSKEKENDIWAFGILIVHLFTREAPWTELGSTRAGGRNVRLIRAIMFGERPACPLGPAQARGLDFRWWRLANECWAQLPRHRPSAAEALRRLSEFHNRLAVSAIPSLEDFVSRAAINLTGEVYDGWPSHATAEGPYLPTPTAQPLSDRAQRLCYWVPAGTTGSSRAMVVLATRYDEGYSVNANGWSQELLQEVSIWLQLRHHNLQPLLGICKLDGIWHAVTPRWQSARAFIDYLESEERRASCYSSQRNAPLLEILKDVAGALAFLHTQHPPIVHGAVHLDSITIGDYGRNLFNGEGTADACLGNYRHMRSLALTEPARHVGADIKAFAALMREVLKGRYRFPGDDDVTTGPGKPPVKIEGGITKLYEACMGDDWKMMDVWKQLDKLVSRAIRGKL